jgi:hypothetical protein
VRYGFELATYAAGWVPYVGWLSGQIMIFYNFGESITQSIAYNVGDWLNGQITFGDGVRNVISDTGAAFVQLGIDQWNFWLPPLPPLPPIPLSTATQQSTAAAVESKQVVAPQAPRTVPRQPTAAAPRMTTTKDSATGGAGSVFSDLKPGTDAKTSLRKANSAAGSARNLTAPTKPKANPAPGTTNSPAGNARAGAAGSTSSPAN